MPKYTTAETEAKKRIRTKKWCSLRLSNGSRILMILLMAYSLLFFVQQIELLLKGSQICSSLNCILSSFISVITVSNIEAYSVLVASMLYLWESGQRRRKVHYEAWQVIDAATGIQTSYARIQALQDLHYGDVSFKQIDLPQTNLNSIKLVYADLRRANLRESILTLANLSNSQLQGVKLQDAKLNSAILVESQLQFANLAGANLAGANLSYANLSYANLTGANLTGAKLSYTNLTSANLKYINLDKADLSHSNLTGVNLNSSKPIAIENLSNKKLISKRKISLKSTIFNCTILKDVTLLFTDINEDDLNNAWLCNTVMPNGRIENRDCVLIQKRETILRVSRDQKISS